MEHVHIIHMTDWGGMEHRERQRGNRKGQRGSHRPSLWRHSLCPVLGWSTYSNTNSLKSFWVWWCILWCTAVFRSFQKCSISSSLGHKLDYVKYGLFFFSTATAMQHDMIIKFCKYVNKNPNHTWFYLSISISVYVSVYLSSIHPFIHTYIGLYFPILLPMCWRWRYTTIFTECSATAVLTL